jgi:aspartate kinase
VSLTLDKNQHTSKKLPQLLGDLKDVADITRKENMSILTLIANINKSSEVLATVFRVFFDPGHQDRNDVSGSLQI